MTTPIVKTTIVDGSPDAMHETLGALRDIVLEASALAGLPKGVTYQLRLAVDEIVTNIIVHGYGESGLNGTITVTSSIDDSMVIIALEDSGPAFDPRTLKKPANLDDPLDTREIGGLGVFLALKSVDLFEYDRLGNKNINRIGMKRGTE